MRYVVVFRTEAGSIDCLEIDASSPDEAIGRSGQAAGSILSVGRTGFGLRAAPAAHPRSRIDPIVFTRQLRTLIEAGLSVQDTLATLAANQPASASGRLCSALLDAVRIGRSFSDALEASPSGLPPLLARMIATGEGTGNLASVLQRFERYAEERRRMLARLRSALIYPAIVVGVSLLVLLFLLFYIVPRFTAVYESVRTELSTPARLLMGWGEFVQGHGVALSVLLVGGLGLVAVSLGRPAVRHWLVERLSAQRLAARHLRRYQQGRLYRTLAMLLTSGLPVAEALSTVRRSLGFRMEAAIDGVTEAVQRGQSMTDALDRAGLLTPAARALLLSAEGTGQLPQMLDAAAGFVEDELAQTAESFARVFEPAIMLALGLAIGGIVILMYMPIFELAGAIQ